MPSSQFVVLFAFFVCTRANPLLSFVTKHATACERDTATLRCEDGSLIDVQRALYGRTDRSTCSSSSIRTTSCSASGALHQVKTRCDGRAFCVVPATNSVFGDPCKGTFKYLQLTYKCRRTIAINAIAHICEHDSGHISCPKGQTLRIIDAFYGRDSRAVCTGKHMQSTSCKASDSEKHIKHLCEGNRSCKIEANNGKFGDPCHGTFKYVKVFFRCL